MITKILIFFIKILLRNSIKGSTVITLYLAKKIKELQEFAVSVPGGMLIFDFRINCFHGIITNSKKLTGEHLISKKIIKHNDVVFDLGANVGLYSVWFSELVGENGKVFSFEPNSILFNSLTKSFSLKKNIQLFPVAISDFNGNADFFLPEDQTMASLSDWTGDLPNTVIKNTCHVKTLDSLLFNGIIPTPSFIKCDIEGGELGSFKGSYNLLNVVEAPIILFEANINTSKGFGLTSLDAIHYLQNLEKPKFKFFLVDDLGELAEFMDQVIIHANILAIPESKIYILNSI